MISSAAHHVDALTINGLTKTYSNGVIALKGIDITVKTGDFFALLGPNGAGKSTLISIITSVTRKTSGQVKIFGHDIDQNFTAAKTYLGVVPQEFNFNVFETVENIILAQAGYYGVAYKQAKEQCEYYLRELHLWEKRKSIARALSGGMKRRLMIARALIHQPQMLILDEPTAGVDIEIRHSMWSFLTQLNQQGITIILTTHYLEEAERLCKKIAIIDHGKIISNMNMNAMLEQLDKEFFILFLRKAINSLPNVPGYKISLLDAMSLEVEVMRQQGLSKLLISLHEQGIEVVSMRNKSTQLEQLFLTLIRDHES